MKYKTPFGEVDTSAQQTPPARAERAGDVLPDGRVVVGWRWRIPDGDYAAWLPQKGYGSPHVPPEPWEYRHQATEWARREGLPRWFRLHVVLRPAKPRPRAAEGVETVLELLHGARRPTTIARLDSERWPVGTRVRITPVQT